METLDEILEAKLDALIEVSYKWGLAVANNHNVMALTFMLEADKIREDVRRLID